METRIITILKDYGNEKYSFNSCAETLAQLKNDLTKEHIDYANMTFEEVISHSTMTSDDSQLPKDVLWKGTVTNNLVFFLYDNKEKTKGGSDRETLYSELRGIFDYYGKGSFEQDYLDGTSYTRVSNDTLEQAIDAYHLDQKGIADAEDDAAAERNRTEDEDRSDDDMEDDEENEERSEPVATDIIPSIDSSSWNRKQIDAVIKNLISTYYGAEAADRTMSSLTFLYKFRGTSCPYSSSDLDEMI